MKSLPILLIVYLFPLILNCQKTVIKKTYYPKSHDKKEQFFVLKKYNRIKDGKYNLFYPTGQIKESGVYKNNKRIGHWKEFNKNGKIRRLKSYKYGRKFTDKKVGIWKESVENGQVIKRFDHDNNISLPPLIYVDIIYPAKAKENNIQGTVGVRINLEKNCNINDLTITKSLSPACDEAALEGIKRSITLMKKYNNDNCDSIPVTKHIEFRLE